LEGEQDEAIRGKKAKKKSPETIRGGGKRMVKLRTNTKEVSLRSKRESDTGLESGCEKDVGRSNF